MKINEIFSLWTPDFLTLPSRSLSTPEVEKWESCWEFKMYNWIRFWLPSYPLELDYTGAHS